MVSKGQNKLVLWPHYFDARRSRTAGRRVPSSLAVNEPDARWVESAARKAGFDVTLEENAKHPSVPYRAVGRVVVSKSDTKEAIIRQVATKLSAGKE